jgi:hypothetical protein
VTEASATPIAEILTQIPESTEVVVIDENGTPVPLASVDAAEIMEGSIPCGVRLASCLAEQGVQPIFPASVS